jgi:hypothetical protein
MPVIAADDHFVSDLFVSDQPIDAEGIDNVEIARTMRRIGLAEGEAGTLVSAFNSSI